MVKLTEFGKRELIAQYELCQSVAHVRNGLFECGYCVRVNNCPVYGTSGYTKRLLPYCMFFILNKDYKGGEGDADEA